MTLVFIAALPAELKPLVDGWKKDGHLYRGRIGRTEAVATCAGMGAAAATRACEQALSAEPAVGAIVSLGYAGSVSCGIQVGSAYAIREVIEAATGEIFPTRSSDGQRLITLDHVAGTQEKRDLATRHQAVLVDMEAATVARFACTHNVGFYAFKAITDGPNDKLPDFNRFTGPDGQLRMPAFLPWLAVHPQYWGAVRNLARNSRRASQQLAEFIERTFAAS
jgi:adenosylhomocysteine nucleosidase